MNRSWNPSELLREMAIRLGSLRERVMFVGGAVTWLHVTDKAANPSRQTTDVDVVVEVASLPEYYRIGHELRAIGFSEDAEVGGPICRWYHGELVLDLLPTDEAILGYSNRWYRDSMSRSWAYAIEGVGSIRVALATDFLAMKLEAFHDRGKDLQGKRDYLGSKDMEDIVTLIDGRPELGDEVRCAASEIRAYIGAEVRSLLADVAFEEALSGHFGGDPTEQARVPIVLARLEKIALLGG